MKGEMDFSKTSVAEACTENPQAAKKGHDPMSGMDAKEMNAVVRSTFDPDMNRLDTWKEIAVYLGREVRTAQRWAKREGLPVHRHFHAKASTIYAFKHEVDAWLQMRRLVTSEPPPKKERSECVAECLNPKLLAARRAPARSWLQDAAARVGSIDLLQGKNRIRVCFYIRVHEEGGCEFPGQEFSESWQE
jgi:hypothetical protein